MEIKLKPECEYFIRRNGLIEIVRKKKMPVDGKLNPVDVKRSRRIFTFKCNKDHQAIKKKLLESGKVKEVK